MPESGPNFFSPMQKKTNSQPELLEQRKAWTKMDRDVKLDIFLSLSDEVKLEIFEASPTQPPSAMTAMEMMQALDENFEDFKFEDYHHAFCHFLNLHVDQYDNLEEFNAEFYATVEDLLDHGFPLDNLSACSAYFSKLRCTQNPWVAKKLREWNTTSSVPTLKSLMKECPPWMVIKPLTTKTAPTHYVSSTSYPEDVPGMPELTAEDEASASDKSEVSTIASVASHSRNVSTESTRSQEITIHASAEDLTDLGAFPMPSAKLAPAPTSYPQRLTSKNSFVRLALSPSSERPLPPLPSETSSLRSRSMSPKPLSMFNGKELRPPPSTPPRSQSPLLQGMENIHPALRLPAAPTPPPTLPLPPVPEQRPRSSQGLQTLAPLAFNPNADKRPSTSRGRSDSKNSAHSTFSPFPAPVRMDSGSSSILLLPLQGAPAPEFHDTIMAGTGSHAQLTSHPNPSSVSLRLSSESSSPLIKHNNASTSNLHIVSNNTSNSNSSSNNWSSHLSVTPPKSFMSRLSAELNDEKAGRKRSWSTGLKQKVMAKRYDIREIV
jgi:hypothetical protein